VSFIIVFLKVVMFNPLFLLWYVFYNNNTTSAFASPAARVTATATATASIFTAVATSG
jgi:hypothetical protein